VINESFKSIRDGSEDRRVNPSDCVGSDGEPRSGIVLTFVGWVRMRLCSLLLLALIAGLPGCEKDQAPQATRRCALSLASNPARDTIAVGASLNFAVANLIELPPGGCVSSTTFTWSVSNSAVASISPGSNSFAEVTGLAPGSTTVSVRASDAAGVSVAKDVFVTSMKIGS
jgi:hypothetical protein